MDVYRTISISIEGPVYKEKKSKFVGYAIPLRAKEDINKHLEQLRGNHQTAAHICYAWILGKQQDMYRVSDDGEPHNSAGMPILGQIKALDITDVLVAVVRYYGGKKLGVGGLINAYRTAAKTVLEIAEIVEKQIQHAFQIQCGYDMVDRILQKARRNQWEVISKKMDESCIIILGLNQDNQRILEEELGYLEGVIIKKDGVE